MTINLTFNDFEEMKGAIVEMAKLITADKMIVKEPKPMEAKKIPEKTEKAPEKAEKNPEKTEKVPEKAEKIPEKEAPVKIDKVEMRKLLSVLNKSTGENTARKLINGMGFKALTDVPDDRLAELKAKAEEVINAQ